MSGEQSFEKEYKDALGACLADFYWGGNHEPCEEDRIRAYKKGQEQFFPRTPEIKGEISATDLRIFLRQYIDKDNIHLLDSKYKLTTIAEIHTILQGVIPNAWNYTEEFADCDDAAFRLTGLLSIGKWAWLAMGITSSSAHTYYSAVTQEEDGLQFYIIEPMEKHGKIYPYADVHDNSTYMPVVFLYY